jgi:ABC-2 type transport system ATP-binding protein
MFYFIFDQGEKDMIHIEKLTKYYNEVCAVDNISIDVQQGEILGLLGPNGAGKTTTLRMLTGFFKPTSGSITIKNYSIDKDLLKIKQLIGYLPESAPLYHSMLVYDYLNFVADIRGLNGGRKPYRIKELVDICGLDQVMHKSISELSKGYKQRVGLAHALLGNPEILILDEPTSGLDPNQIVEIRQIIKQIGKEKTIIFSTHILSEAEATCDRIAIIHKGKIVADENTEAIKKSSAGECAINILLENCNFETVEKTLNTIPGVKSILLQDNENENQLKIKLSCEAASDIMGNIYRKIRETEWIILEFYQETKTLENIFRELTLEK